MDGSGATQLSYEADVLEWSRQQAPGLRPLLNDAEGRDVVWGHAVTRMARETNLDEDFGESCP